MVDVQTSIHGKRLGLGNANQIISNGVEISRPCVDATITVGAENTNVRAITIQLKDAKGADINYVETVELILFLNAARTAFVVTGGSTGIAIGTDGALLAIVAKKYTASAFLARALGDLSRTGSTLFHPGKATGRWAYNTDISWWALAPEPEWSQRLSWEDTGLSMDYVPGNRE